MNTMNIPNYITASRIVFSLMLLFTIPLSPLFFILYLLCGLSDILDGYIARRTNSKSTLGATLDSLSDAIFIGVSLIVFIPLFQWPLWLLVWIGGIALIRFLSLLIGLKKYKTLCFLHTYSNKATGLLLFMFPVFYQLFDLNLTAFFLCSIATLSSLEELAVNVTSVKLERDIRTIFELSHGGPKDN